MLFQTHSHETCHGVIDQVVVGNAGFILSLAGNAMKSRNYVRKVREDRLMSKAELARLAGVSAATIDRIERGELCRMETIRKIILALGFTLEDKDKVFPD